MEALDAFEKFLHDEKVKLPVLIKAALAHVQFESIHPFLDGNGRLGRLLITFILCAEGLMKSPLLYLSLYLKQNRQAYYDHLQSVRQTGDWEAWIEFFLKGVIEVANQATETAQALLALIENDRAKIRSAKKAAGTLLNIHGFFQKHPLATTTKIAELCRVSRPTVMRSLAALEALGIVKETTGKERHKLYVYQDYIALLNQGTEPLANNR